jgi:hypothetical protein
LIEVRKAEVVADGMDEDQTLVLSVLGEEADASSDGVGGALKFEGLAVEGDGAGVGAVRADEQARGLGAAGTDEAGEAEDFAAADFEGDVLDGGSAAEVANDEAGFTDVRSAGRERLAMSRVATWRPSRRMVARSQSSKTSSRRWLT